MRRKQMERPILFSNNENVLAILNGTKTQARRLVKNADECPYRLGPAWVKETYCIVPVSAYRESVGVDQVISPDGTQAAVFKAGWDRSPPNAWRSPRLMPKWASRMTVEIEEISIEHLQEIDEEGATKEGCDNSKNEAAMSQGWYEKPIAAFKRQWERTNGRGSWDKNPLVWVIEFKLIKPIAEQARIDE